MQIVREFFRPSLKCERLGHKPVREVRGPGYVMPSGSRSAVADGATIVRHICPRCRAELSDTTFEDRYPIHSLSMASSRMNKLRDCGYILKA